MAKQINRNQDFAFVIKEQLGIIETFQNGWSKEVNLIEWNGNQAKLDIRDWDPTHEHMSRGVTLHKFEVLALMEILLEHYGDDLAEKRADSQA